MKTSLTHLPPRKRTELARIVGRICERVPDIQMIILFGSHTTNDWVEDIYTEGHTTYEYLSDFDILVIVESNKVANSTNIWHRLDKTINVMHMMTPVTIIAHDIKFVNKRLKQGQYFFTDIKKEGIILYDSGQAKLARRKTLDPAERAELAKDDFKHWFKTAKDFYRQFEHAFDDRTYKIAAFNLHQTTEALYSALLLVYTNYKPKTHDLEKFSRLAANHDRAFFKIFPQATKPQKKCFDLLNRAYIDARYKKKYRITKKQLEYLAQRVKKLQRLTNKTCKEKIKSFI